ncbi:hypothetical protein GON01_02560 [Sphingomonas sp. MAH-20]|uniref:MEDS domain-containing protein n=2 Tax=Sphingomonadaceae TaxID=41297 RepID=A0A6I4IY09_9SPHN|nr:hypothetical protein [Sphingomonas horti]
MGDVRHACAFFSGVDEAYRVLLPFIAEGFDRGDKAIHVISPDDEAEHLERLASAGIDPGHARATGQLELRNTTDVYLNGGRFDQDRMLASFETIAAANASSGFPATRIVCNMDWTADHRPQHEDIIEFEARVVTEVAEAGPFWEAEPEHQDYLERVPNGYTCHFPRPGWVLPRRLVSLA